MKGVAVTSVNKITCPTAFLVEGHSFDCSSSNNSRASAMVLVEPSGPSRGVCKTFWFSDNCFSSAEQFVNSLKWLKCTSGFCLTKQQPPLKPGRFLWALSLCMFWPLWWAVSCSTTEMLPATPVSPRLCITMGLNHCRNPICVSGKDFIKCIHKRKYTQCSVDLHRED